MNLQTRSASPLGRTAVRRQFRKGLTLMELVVVMFILMALAAIMVPLFPSLIERAHRSSQATNASEITKAVQLFQSINGNYPDGYDLLTDGTNIINYFPAVPTPQPMLFGDLHYSPILP